jgi:hypothetical protein
MVAPSAADKAAAIAKLRELLPPGSTVYTILRHVSRSGMQRKISCYAFLAESDGSIRPYWLDSFISKATGLPLDRKYEALTVNGCGMDMGHAIVDDIAWAIRQDPETSTVPYRLSHRWL